MAAFALAVGLTAVTAGSVSATQPATNVIVMIADGWGFNHLDSASYYEYGKADRQVFDRFPFEFAMSTYMAYDEGEGCEGWGYDPGAAWGDFGYVMECATDSAAAATAMSTGVKTDDGTIGLDADDVPLVHALERAEGLGKATGVVTSVQLSHATPAGFVAHNTYRSNYAAIANEMIYDSGADVVMGAGHPFWDDDGQPAEFQALASGPTPSRVFGVAPVEDTLQLNRGGDYLADPFAVPFISTVPTLEEMTKAALNVLDDDPDGLFLMIEGGAIDWASHGNYSPNSSGRMVEEFIDFERSVEAVIDWVNSNSDWGETLLIVTGDHETGYLNGPESDPSWEPIGNNGAGVLPAMEWHGVDHTNSLIPLFAKGSAGHWFKDFADSFDPVRGRYLDNTELAAVIFTALG
jgi:alkaline phosphatase